MAAGGGTNAYSAPVQAPEPNGASVSVADLLVDLVYAVRDPETQCPFDALSELVQAGIATPNDVRLIASSWAETHAFPSFLVSPQP